MEKRGDEETSDEAKTTDCAKESPKEGTAEGGMKQSGGGKKEVVVATWNRRTLDMKGNNNLGHVETLLL